MDELGRHSTKWTEKQQIQIRDMECMSVKYPMPPLSPLPRKDVINGHDQQSMEGMHTVLPDTDIDRYGFHDHVMPPPMKMSGHHHAAIGLQTSTYDLKGSAAGNMMMNNGHPNEFEVGGMCVCVFVLS